MMKVMQVQVVAAVLVTMKLLVEAPVAVQPTVPIDLTRKKWTPLPYKIIIII